MTLEEEKAIFRSYLETEKLELERRMNRPRRLLLVDSLATRVRESKTPQLHCNKIVRLALDIHEQQLKENGGMCRQDKYHSILYVAAKLCTDSKLEDTEVVCSLLQAIFLCEQTFERLLVSAIFGAKISHYYSGWRSDYDNEQENMAALEYFLSHSTLGHQLFLAMGSHMRMRQMRFLEVTMESYNRAMPLYVTVYIRNPEALLLLLRFSAPLDTHLIEAGVDPPVMHILQTLSNHHNLTEYPKDWVMCLKFLMRATPRVNVRLNSEVRPNWQGTNHQSLNERFLEVHPRLVNDELLPENRYLHPAELKHLCRCTIRRRLHDNWGLPHAINRLPLPAMLRTYLDLLED